jgi:hypothetical protein
MIRVFLPIYKGTNILMNATCFSGILAGVNYIYQYQCNVCIHLIALHSGRGLVCIESKKSK